MNDLEKLLQRIRIIQWSGLALFLLTVVARLLVRAWRPELNGLIVGELGGAVMVFSMIRQSHLRDNLQGAPLMISGVIGFVIRIVVLIAVMVVALKVPGVNAYAALGGYLLGFVFIVVGLYGYNGHNDTQGK